MNKKEKAKLHNIYNSLTAKQRFGDEVESYTTGYRLGHSNGQIELLEYILNIDKGIRTQQEKIIGVDINCGVDSSVNWLYIDKKTIK